MFLINFNQWKCACVGINNWVIMRVSLSSRERDLLWKLNIYRLFTFQGHTGINRFLRTLYESCDSNGLEVRLESSTAAVNLPTSFRLAELLFRTKSAILSATFLLLLCRQKNFSLSEVLHYPIFFPSSHLHKMAKLCVTSFAKLSEAAVITWNYHITYPLKYFPTSSWCNC